MTDETKNEEKGFLDKLKDAAEELKDKAEAVWDKVEDKAEEIWDKVEDKAEEALAAAKTAAGTAKDNISKKIDELKGDAGENKPA